MRKPRLPRFASAVLPPLLAGLAGAPAHAEREDKGFVWVDELPESAPTNPEGEYVIGIGDLLSIQVWEQDKISARMRVRSDGRVSLPLLNDVEAAGRSPMVLARELETGLATVVRAPQVTVVVEESSPLAISILGEVASPGLHRLEAGSGLAQALAAAGGLGRFARKDRIYVLRGGGKPLRIRFSYEHLVRLRGRAARFRLRSGDVVVAE